MESELNYTPLVVYKKYIDDILIGPLNKRTLLVNHILKVLYSVNKDIQFTSEVPQSGDPIAFLDMTLWIKENKAHYKWHTKPCHSENTLSKNSWIPNAIKDNFLFCTIKMLAACALVKN